MKSKIYSSDYIKASSKGQLWIPAFFTLGFFMVFPVMELLMFGNWFETEYMSIEWIWKMYEALWQDGFMSMGFAVAGCGAVLNGINSFWYLYSSRKTDFYHSIPVKRSRMFWHKTYIGILYYLIPYVIMVFLSVCIGAMRGFFSLKIVGMALIMLLIHFVLYLMIYFGVVLVICVTGNLLMGVLCMGGLYLYGPVLGILLEFYRTIFYSTYYDRKKYGLLEFLNKYASPYLLGKTFLKDYIGGNYGGMLVVILIVTSIFGLLAYLAYVKRPSESAGKSIIYDWIGVVIKFMVVVPCGLGIGAIFQLMQYRNSQGGWWIFGMILGTLLSHGIIEVVYQMDFRKFMSKKHHLVLAGILVAVCAVTYKADFFHFDTYLPKQEELAALNFDFISILGESNEPIIENGDGTYRSVNSWDSEEASVTKENRVDIQIWKVMEQIVAAQDQKAEKDINNSENLSDRLFYILPVKYTLNSGQEVYRQYHMTTKNLYDLRKVLYEEGNLKEKNTSFLKIDQSCLQGITGHFINGEASSVFQNDTKKQKELLEALSADMEEATAEDMLEQPIAAFWLDYKILQQQPDTIQMYQEEPNSRYSYIYRFIFVHPSFQRTLAILKETGYPMSMDEVDMTDIKINYFGNQDVSSTSVIYHKKEEVEALKKGLVPYSLQGYWISYDNSFNIEVNMENSHKVQDYTMASELVPDFVKEMKEKTGADQIGIDEGESYEEEVS